MLIEVNEDGEYYITLKESTLELLDWEVGEELDYYIDDGNIVIFAV